MFVFHTVHLQQSMAETGCCVSVCARKRILDLSLLDQNFKLFVYSEIVGVQ